MTQSNSFAISSDLPIRGSADDQFSFTPFAEEVVRYLFNEEQPESLVVGLSGKWGSGKTSFLNLIEEQLTNYSPNGKQILTIRYVPWRVEDRKSLLSSFLPLLTEKIEKEAPKSINEESDFPDMFEHVKRYVNALENIEPALKVLAKVLSAFGVSVLEKGLDLAEDLNSAFQDDTTPDIESLYQSAYDALGNLKIPVIVMIDDIDRLEPEEIVHMLRLVRATAQLPYITFILSYDQVHVTAAVREVLKVNGQEFLEKFVQLPIAVPLVDQVVLNELVQNNLEELIISLGEPESVQEKNLDSVEKIITTTDAADALKTPRDVSRILNTVAFRVNSKTANLNFESSVYLSIIQAKFPLLFEWLVRFIEKNNDRLINATNNVKYNLDEIKRFVEPNSSNLLAVKDLVEATLVSFKKENAQ